jgi:hypothetical protein
MSPKEITYESRAMKLLALPFTRRYALYSADIDISGFDRGGHL